MEEKCYDERLPSNLKYPLECIVIAACDLCLTLGYVGDTFYMGNSDFTGHMTHPHLCQSCFRRHAAKFFQDFERITGCKVIFTETCLELKEKDVKMVEYMKMVEYLHLPIPYSDNGVCDHGWYMKLLEKLIELTQDSDTTKILVEATFLNTNKE